MAPATGVITFKTVLGDNVHAGDLLGEIIDTQAESTARARHPVVSPNDGLVYEFVDSRYVIEGQCVCQVAGAEPLAGQRENLLLD